MKKSIKFNLDSEGFISRECPSCERQFKIKYGEGADGPLNYCPYCEHEGLDCWWTQAQVEYLEVEKSLIAHELIDGAFKDFNKPGSGFTFKPSSRPASTEPPPELDNGWEIVIFDSGEQLKHDGASSELRCPVTGSRIRKN